jgi:hypothetical protein
MHVSNKTLGQRNALFLETFEVLQRHFQYVPLRWILAEVCYKADGRDQFFEPIKPTIARYFASLPLGLKVNRVAPGKFFSEWLRFATPARIKTHLTG